MTEPGTTATSQRKKSYARRVLRIGLTFLITPYLALAGVVTAFQRSLIYHPTPDHTLNSRVRQLNQFHIEPLGFQTAEGVELNGWHIAAENQPGGFEHAADRNRGRLTVLYFCGNAGHRAYRLMDFALLLDCGCDVICFDYRGFGDNPGSPGESVLADDAQAVWRYLVKMQGIPPNQIVLFGESLGGGVATRLAAEMSTTGTPPAGLILRSTFSSLTDTAIYHFPWLPVRLLLVDRFPSVDRIPHVNCPILMLHGEQDSIVPYRLGQKLFAAAPARSRAGIEKQFVSLPQSDHNDVLETAGSAMRVAILEFVDRILLTENVRP